MAGGSDVSPLKIEQVRDLLLKARGAGAGIFYFVLRVFALVPEGVS